MKTVGMKNNPQYRYRGIFMALTESKRRANNKWDAANMTVLGCKVRKDKAARFKAACAESGTTVNAVFTAAMDHFMESHQAAGSTN